MRMNEDDGDDCHELADYDSDDDMVMGMPKEFQYCIAVRPSLSSSDALNSLRYSIMTTSKRTRARSTGVRLGCFSTS